MAGTPLPIAAYMLPPLAQIVNFHGWVGWIPSLQNQIDRQQRPGQNGRVAQNVGLAARDVQCTACRFESVLANATAFAAIVEGLKDSTSLKMVDPWLRFMSIRITDSSAEVTCGRGPTDSNVPTRYKIICNFMIERMPDA